MTEPRCQSWHRGFSNARTVRIRVKTCEESVGDDAHIVPLHVPFIYENGAMRASPPTSFKRFSQ